LNVYFNLLNKSIFKYFPFPYTVSTVHVVVGTIYCGIVYLLGMKNLSFGRVRRAGGTPQAARSRAWLLPTGTA
jgi:hypothetical protein